MGSLYSVKACISQFLTLLEIGKPYVQHYAYSNLIYTLTQFYCLPPYEVCSSIEWLDQAQYVSFLYK